jgi:hypothetical protein
VTSRGSSDFAEPMIIRLCYTCIFEFFSEAIPRCHFQHEETMPREMMPRFEAIPRPVLECGDA